MLNQNRRKFIKTSVLCGGFFFLGRLLGSVAPGFSKNIDYEKNNSFSKNRREDEEKVVYYDNKGNKVLVVEKT